MCVVFYIFDIGSVIFENVPGKWLTFELTRSERTILSFDSHFDGIINRNIYDHSDVLPAIS